MKIFLRKNLQQCLLQPIFQIKSSVSGHKFLFKFHSKFKKFNFINNYLITVTVKIKFLFRGHDHPFHILSNTIFLASLTVLKFPASLSVSMTVLKHSIAFLSALKRRFNCLMVIFSYKAFDYIF